jgi:membrane-bound inhibitor of C-type lysozyme
MKNFIFWLVVAVLVACGVYYFWHTEYEKNIHTVVFSCDGGKSITAAFDLSTNGGVKLALSDGRNLSLSHVISADGARYANADQSIVFWNVGNTASVAEGAGAGAVTTYANCIIFTK